MALALVAAPQPKGRETAMDTMERQLRYFLYMQISIAGGRDVGPGAVRVPAVFDRVHDNTRQVRPGATSPLHIGDSPHERAP